MFAGFMRFLWYVILAYLAFVFLRFLLKPARRKRPSPPPPRLSGIMVKDEICNTYLPKEQAIREVKNGKEHYFCSKECRQKFIEGRKEG